MSEQQAIRAVLSLHCKQSEDEAGSIGPYCAECTSPIDGGPELYPCMTVKAILDALAGAGAEPKKKVSGDSAQGRIRELLKHLDHWEKQEHTTVTITYLRRHFKGKK